MSGHTTLLSLTVIILLSTPALQADETETATRNTVREDFSRTAQPFLREFCVPCHNSDITKGNVRFDLLDNDVSQHSNHERWRQILNRVRSGEMPPPGNPQPNELQVSDFLRAIAANLDDAAIANRNEGRVILRRLNRVEYENTVRDLFNVDVSVRDMLPEDTISHGFDNVGAALNVSPVLIERYLEAADAVLNAAVAPVHSEESKTERFDLYDSLPKWFLAGTWKQNEGVILFRSGGDSASDLRKFRAPAPGRYRFRIAASAHNSDTPLPMAALLGNFVVSGNPTRHLGYFDAPPGQPGIIEFEEKLLAKNDTIKVKCAMSEEYF